ncbi:DUF1168 domain protein [Cordyceps fumosorosea ARSEF 2679]|uniref:DUF1168 domain protein n=1 Tax=Cordyceps fumosorosea (strain ARSEF 2679) TaxID=1081104 RepID=A0A167R1S1_CORFA|nr:DUF1168 domain protein [Cordyceps fumosorosea ARSEF 2679]OAA58188.1 DUF1168 domain protein [Cordyceps fumosorosea ARSEF 2679]
MSAEIPESIPTSADPRSHRPTKRRALSPSSAHAASVSALFAKPDRDIRLPGGGGRPTHAHSRPPEIVANVQGSSAGAGSGEFHVYKAARRREYERLRAMDEDVRREREQEAFERDREGRERRDEERTRRNRDKREKMRARKAGKGKTGGSARGSAGGGVKPTNVVAGREREEEDAEEGKNGTAGAAAAEPGLVIHDED